jgi:hypothetical protein
MNRVAPIASANGTSAVAIMPFVCASCRRVASPSSLMRWNEDGAMRQPTVTSISANTTASNALM